MASAATANADSRPEAVDGQCRPCGIRLATRSSRLLDIRCASLKPYLNFIAIWVTNEGVRQAGTEFATRSDDTPSALDRCHSHVNIFRRGKSKPKVNDPTGAPAPAGRFSNARTSYCIAKIFTHAKRQRPVWIKYGECDVAKSVRLDNGTPSNKGV